MGNILSQPFCCFPYNPPPTRRILIVGPPGAGKSSILRKLGTPVGEPRKSLSRPGFPVEVVRFRGLEFTVLDVFGTEEERPHYRSFFENTRGIIFVLDSSSRSSFDEAREVLRDLTEDEELFGVPLLVFANKNDTEDAASEEEVALRLQLADVRGPKCGVYSCAALHHDQDTSFYEGLNWLADQLEVDDRIACDREYAAF